VAQSLRRIKPEKFLKQLKHRDRSQLPFLSATKLPLPQLLLDTTVYVDALQGTLPPEVAVALQVARLWHSTVTEAELAALAGVLDPEHAETAKVISQVAASIDRRPQHRVLVPDLAGLLARLQSYGKSERRRAMNDALIFLSAAKHGCDVLTRNTTDFDLLMQVAPWGRAMFYNRS
jgi:predicted nucleic acid-binding protein